MVSVVPGFPCLSVPVFCQLSSLVSLPFFFPFVLLLPPVSCLVLYLSSCFGPDFVSCCIVKDLFVSVPAVSWSCFVQ